MNDLFLIHTIHTVLFFCTYSAEVQRGLGSTQELLDICFILFLFTSLRKIHEFGV